jgi:hypothetical protein
VSVSSSTSRSEVPVGSACHHGRHDRRPPALLAQATDEAKSNTERLFAGVALRKQIDWLIGALDDGPTVSGIAAAVAGRIGSSSR